MSRSPNALQKTQNLDSFILPARVAKLIGVHVRTLRRWERAGHSPRRRSLTRLKARLPGKRNPFVDRNATQS